MFSVPTTYVLEKDNCLVTTSLHHISIHQVTVYLSK